MVQTSVWLNGVRYPIVGEVTSRRITPFSPPFSTGEAETTDYRPLRTWRMGPFQGGMGMENWEPGTEDRYWYAINVDCSRNFQTLGPLVTTLGNFGVAPEKIIYARGKIWAIGNGEVAYWNDPDWTTGEPSAGEGGPIANPTDAIVYYDTTNGESLVIADAALGVFETHDNTGATWVNIVTNDRAYLAEFQNRLCGIANSFMGFGYSAIGDIATAWTPKSTFPNLPYTCTGLLSAKDAQNNPVLYALTTSGMYSLDVFDNFYQYPSGLHWARDSTAGKAAIYAKGDMYIAAGGTRILKVSGNVVTEWGPDTDDGLQDELLGDITDIISVGYWIVIAVDGGTGNYSSILKRYMTGAHWHVVYNSGATNKRIKALCWDDGTLYFGESTHVKSLPLSNKTDNYKHLTTHTFVNTGHLYTSNFSSRFESMPKVAFELWCKSQDMSATETVQAYYDIDDSGSWTSLGTFNASPRDDPLTFGTAAVGLEFNRIKFDYVFSRGGTTTKSPKVERFELKYDVYPPDLEGWQFRANCVTKGEKSGKSMIADLETARATKTLLAFYPTGKKSDTVKYVRIRGDLVAESGTERGQEGIYVVNVEEVIED